MVDLIKPNAESTTETLTKSQTGLMLPANMSFQTWAYLENCCLLVNKWAYISVSLSNAGHKCNCWIKIDRYWTKVVYIVMCMHRKENIWRRTTLKRTELATNTCSVSSFDKKENPEHLDINVIIF